MSKICALQQQFKSKKDEQCVTYPCFIVDWKLNCFHFQWYFPIFCIFPPSIPLVTLQKPFLSFFQLVLTTYTIHVCKAVLCLISYSFCTLSLSVYKTKWMCVVILISDLPSTESCSIYHLFCSVFILSYVCASSVYVCCNSCRLFCPLCSIFFTSVLVFFSHSFYPSLNAALHIIILLLIAFLRPLFTFHCAYCSRRKIISLNLNVRIVIATNQSLTIHICIEIALLQILASI